MNTKKAKLLFEEARAYCAEHYPDMLEWATQINPDTFKNMRSKEFLSNYCHVVYVSGFRVDTIIDLFPQLQTAFKDFNLDALSRMRSIDPVLKIFKNETKAQGFLDGCKQISCEGFSKFKQRLNTEGVDMLEELGGIGEITKFHLAKNIGLIDKAKPDIWLKHVAKLCDTEVDDLVKFLSKEYLLSQHVVDVILWRYGADGRLGQR